MNNLKKKEKVFVALSGGVDSAVSAALLAGEGYDVTGVFMKNWSGDDFGIQADCPWETDQKDAENVCKKLGIQFHTFNFEKEYREKVVSYFFSEFKAGRTPNPDVLCNKEIKFGIFLNKALEMGADLIATGHYARVRYDQDSGEFQLLKGFDTNKDQSYFLCELDQRQLSKTLFPIGNMLKPEVRKLAKKFQLNVSKKPDSQGICFVGEINIGKFLRVNIKTHQGNIIDIDNNIIVGKHDGIEFYTIGQREGLNIGGSKEPYFVVRKDIVTNIIYVAQSKNNPHLFKRNVSISEIHWINSLKYIDLEEIDAMIRYRQKPSRGKLNETKSEFIFDTPQRAIAEGQLLALYNADILIASAVIN